MYHRRKEQMYAMYHKEGTEMHTSAAATLTATSSPAPAATHASAASIILTPSNAFSRSPAYIFSTSSPSTPNTRWLPICTSMQGIGITSKIGCLHLNTDSAERHFMLKWTLANTWWFK